MVTIVRLRYPEASCLHRPLLYMLHEVAARSRSSSVHTDHHILIKSEILIYSQLCVSRKTQGHMLLEAHSVKQLGPGHAQLWMLKQKAGLDTVPLR
jgi:hypothetical protein